jgi:hypothetical protein
MGDVMQRLKDGVGFKIDEVMSGEHQLEAAFGAPKPQPLEFRVTWGTTNLARWVMPGSAEFMTSPLEGTITAGGLCHEAPCKGTLELRYFDEHKIRYAFEFEVSGKRYGFVGEKVNIWPWNLPYSHTTCFGRLTEVETGKLVSTSVTHFRAVSAPAFLLSFRLTSDDGPTTPA